MFIVIVMHQTPLLTMKSILILIDQTDPSEDVYSNKRRGPRNDGICGMPVFASPLHETL